MTIVKIHSVAALAAATLTAMVSLGCTTAPEVRQHDLRPRSLMELHAVDSRQARFQHPHAVALVLGGGGLRGFAHIGVLRALEEAGIRPDIVVGTSAGAAVGAAFASGLTASQIEDAASRVDLSSLADWTLSTQGFIRGEAIAQWIDAVTNHLPVERFPIRFAAVATDLRSQRTVVLDSGSAGRAVQASAAVPGVSMPVAYAAGHLIDGGATSLVPVSVARAMGAEVVIAIDIYCGEPHGADISVPAVVSQVMRAQSCRIAEIDKAAADIVIGPTVGPMKLSDRAQHARAIAAGYQAAQVALAQAVWTRGAGRHLPHAAAAARTSDGAAATARPVALLSPDE